MQQKAVKHCSKQMVGLLVNDNSVHFIVTVKKQKLKYIFFSCNSLKSGVEDSEIGLNYSDLFFGTNK